MDGIRCNKKDREREKRESQLLYFTLLCSCTHWRRWCYHTSASFCQTLPTLIFSWILTNQPTKGLLLHLTPNGLKLILWIISSVSSLAKNRDELKQTTNKEAIKNFKIFYWKWNGGKILHLNSSTCVNIDLNGTKIFILLFAY